MKRSILLANLIFCKYSFNSKVCILENKLFPCSGKCYTALDNGYLSLIRISKTYLQLLKPAFTIIRDKNSRCFFLLIRGTHSMKDTLTAATGAVVPFHHSVLHDGGISNLVLGYAHCGMVAAARWIAKLSFPFLIKALTESPDYKIKVTS